ncbi:hypothetical protein [Arthrobacter sp. efr-133-R2A-120]|uniref:hypothetical protein n=1 Tax=Arthrobacter sp. efr-133-R2A-120 TaxID=3040277 RepID=UPI00254A210A|nr:hypothetical protein [Arthrobacter sp. efr-133-R2A-120]
MTFADGQLPIPHPGLVDDAAHALIRSGGNGPEEDLEPQRVGGIPTRAVAAAQSEILEESPAQAGSAASSIQDLLSTWGRVLKLACDIDPEVWALCDEDPARAEAVIEVLSQVFTNVIRHGERNRVRVTMSASKPRPPQAAADTGAIHISFSSPGRLRPRNRPGLGMTTLQNLSKDVTLTADGDNVLLRVGFP